MLNLDAIIRPTLLLDQQKCQQNIQRMVKKASDFRLIFRPHFKTHQSRVIGRWFKEFGTKKITVSSLLMAEYFAADGWLDITVAFPVNLREMDLINSLAGKIQLNLLVEDEHVVRTLATRLKKEIGLFIKIDTGYHRTGIKVDDVDQIDRLLEEIKQHPHLNFIGFLTHAGNTYSARSKKEILNIHLRNLTLLSKLKHRYKSHFPEMIISIGDTPSCSVAADFDFIDETRPGNFVFYDVMQWIIGSCGLGDIAVALACPVVAKHPERKEIVLYGGAIHLSKDNVKLAEGQTIYGLMVFLNEKGWQVPEKILPVISLSQEHGIVKVDDNEALENIKIGDLVGIIPIHSCLTANLMGQYLTLDNQVITHFTKDFKR